MPESQMHPAFYASRRQLWATLSTNKVSCFWRFIQNIGLGSNCTSLGNVWYVVFTTSSISWLLVRAIWRYKDFKAQAYNPRFGNNWDENNTLYFQLGSIICSLCLLPLLIYSALCRVGHSANDSVILGKDILHLQNLLLSFPALQKFTTAYSSNGYGNTSNRYHNNNNNSTTIPNGSVCVNGVTRPREHSSFEEETLDPFILKRRGEDFYEQLSSHFRPFSSILYVLITYLFLLPICIMEAEQIKNEAIDPRFVFHSNVDRLFGQSAAEKYTAYYTQHLGIKINQEINGLLASDVKSIYENERPFPSHIYPSIPSEISVEYICFIISLFMLTIQYAAPFYFTSRIFCLLFSMYIALTGVFLLIDVETISIFYKLYYVGVRDPGGSVVIQIDSDQRYISPWYCVILSAAGLPAIIICLMAIYAYGEAKFKEAVTNYAQLLISGEIPSLNKTNRMTSNKTTDYDTANNNNPDSIGTIETMVGEQTGMEPSYQDAIVHLPITLAVTTKLWRPPPSSRRNGQTVKRSNTPLPGSQSQNNISEMSTSLKRNRGIPLSTSTELTNSIHTLNETNNSSTKSPLPRWSRIGLSIVATVTFIWLLVIRICLMSSILKCYWKTGLELALTDTILSVLYLICWLILWFGLSVKTAWRFRLLHTSNYIGVNGSKDCCLQKDIFPNECDNQGFGASSLHPPMHMNINGAYPNLWPYVSYPPWITSGTMITAGLPIGTNGDVQHVNNQVNGLTVGQGSAGDSLYGCFPDLTNQVQNQSVDAPNQYHPHSRCISLPSGPPTLSEGSDTTTNQPDRNECNNSSKYFRPVATPSLGGSTYLNENQGAITEAHQPYAPSQMNLPRSRTTQEISFCDAYEQFAGQNSSRNRGTNVNSSVMNNQRHGISPMVPEPTYATLANLSRPSAQNNAFRPNSVTPLDSHNRDKTSPTNICRNVSYRRPCTRVTFQDIDNNFSGSRIIINDGATGSSDSGVCTNGHGSSIQQGGNHLEKQHQKGKIKPELFNMFEPNIYQKSVGQSGFDRNYSVHMKDANLLNNNNNNITHTDNDVEMSTDMTSFAIKLNHKPDECISYMNHHETGDNLQRHTRQSHHNDPDDRLCSQV
uniref:Uncharacterized protein n=1 Tax=Trichobilharzia regenti TaxID=157069 RepID=A0AA85K405_TRIRE|nr:unnamed protein product [Trichobilharzia regenti]